LFHDFESVIFIRTEDAALENYLFLESTNVKTGFDFYVIKKKRNRNLIVIIALK